MKFRRPYNMPRNLAAPPFNDLRSQLYPRLPDQAAQGIQQSMEGKDFPKPWLNRDVKYGRTPNTAYNAIQAQSAQDALLRAANKQPVSLPQVQALLDFNAPVALKRTLPGPSIRQIPFIPRSLLPAEALVVQAALNNPMRVRGVRVVEPDFDNAVRDAKSAMYRRFR